MHVCTVIVETHPNKALEMTVIMHVCMYTPNISVAVYSIFFYFPGLA